MAGREAGMMATTGTQGVGKTYKNMYIIKDYIRDKFTIKVKGRKCLIFDVNGEYTEKQFADNGINIKVQKLKMADVEAWGRSPVVECRRIDAKNLSLKQKKECLAHIIKVYRNGMLVIEDINNYLLNISHMEEIVGGLINLRHRAVDVLVSYQSLRAVEPRIYQNSRWMRMHYQNDNVNDIKSKLTNPELFKIAQLIVNKRYHEGDERVFVYIFISKNKLEGDFTLDEYKNACDTYLRSTNKKKVKEIMESLGCSKEEAISKEKERLIRLYYNNKK